ncbi:hypothetical protein ACFPRL_00955 [Pseudoclavibacter helvolus]
MPLGAAKVGGAAATSRPPPASVVAVPTARSFCQVRVTCVLLGRAWLTGSPSPYRPGVAQGLPPRKHPVNG